MLVIVPSRGRPKNVARLAKAFAVTTTLDDTVLLVCVDDNDRRLDSYRELVEENLYKNLVLIVGPPQRIGPLINEHAVTLAPTTDIIGFMGDDHVPRTHGWDAKTTEHLSTRRPGVAYGNDLVHGEAIPTAAFLTSDIVSSLGYFVPPGMIHLFFDNYWKTLGQSLQSILYDPNIVIQHMHPIVGQAEWDETYVAANASDVWDADQKRYDEWVAHELKDAVRKIRGSSTV